MFHYQSTPLLSSPLKTLAHTIMDKGFFTFAKRENNIMGELYIVSREIAAISEIEK